MKIKEFASRSNDLIKYKGEFYIRASSSLVDSPLRVLKHADTFCILNQYGDIRPFGFEDHGLFHEGTRFLSRLDLTLDGRSPLFLSSHIKEENDFLSVDLTNLDFETRDGIFLPRGSIHFVRTIFILDSRLYEQLKIRNYSECRVRFLLEYEFEADFVDIFELRGVRRKKRGKYLSPLIGRNRMALRYQGLDGRERISNIILTPAPHQLSQYKASYQLELKPRAEKMLELTVECRIGGASTRRLSFSQACQKAERLYRELREDICRIETSNEQFNDWLNQSRADLFMLLTRTPFGFYPYGGIPWFSTIFGRDGIITALETLWIYPQIARGVLGYLASKQAREFIPEQEAEPGKIIHEERKGEMASLKEIPFGQYYGSIDATPLFIILAGAYYQRSGDREFIEKLWPHIELALEWIDRYGDLDGDGFIEYEQKGRGGLENQGWRDSDDSVFHSNGELAHPPIALSEVQGYVYQAKIQASELALLFGYSKKAKKLRRQAQELKARFQQAFWSEEIKSYALALDRYKNPCRVRASSAGHCLFAGIASKNYARKMVENFFKPEFFTGWGIRTLSSREARFNPMSYHNGSVWPHDNALIAYGLARYGFKKGCLKIMTGLFDASLFMDLHRLPELFCGFARRPKEGPTLYPVACNPQAWASAAVFMLLQACLGISINAPNQKVYFIRPVLPRFLEEVKIINLKVGETHLDIILEYHPEDVGIKVARRKGKIEIVSVK